MRKIEEVIVAGAIIYICGPDTSGLVVMIGGFDFIQLAKGIHPDALEILLFF